MAHSTKKKRKKEFKKFHKKNPHVFELFKRFAREILNRGFTQYSIYAIAHRIRWHSDIETFSIETSKKKFKLPNNHLPFYARKLIKKYPNEFKGFFKICNRE